MPRPEQHQAFEGTPLAHQIVAIENQLSEYRREISRITNDLLSERSLRESVERERDDYKGQVEGLQAKVDFFRDRSIMAISMAAGLVATVRGFLPQGGQQVLSIFKTLRNSVNKQIQDLDELVKDHLAGTKELMVAKRKEKDAKASEDVATEEAARAIGAPLEAPIVAKSPSLEEIQEKIAELLDYKPREVPRGEPHLKIRGDLGEVAGRVLAREGGEEVPVPENDAGRLLDPEKKGITARVLSALSGKSQ